jgi:hypothetical protein
MTGPEYDRLIERIMFTAVVVATVVAVAALGSILARWAISVW